MRRIFFSAFRLGRLDRLPDVTRPGTDKLVRRGLFDGMGDPARRSPQRDLKAMLDSHLLAESGTSPTDPTKRYTLGERASFRTMC